MNRMLIILALCLVILGCKSESEDSTQPLIVCLTFDDCCESVYKTALPIMEKYGYRGTVFSVSGYVGKKDRLSWSQLDTLYNEYHWEIGGHTLNHKHLSTLTPVEAEYQISADFDSLYSHGLKPVSFAFPFGDCPEEYYPLVTKFYKNVRSTINSSMRNPIDRTRLGTYGIGINMSAEFIANRVTQGIAEQENLVVYMFHDIIESPTLAYSSYNPEKFSDFISRLHQMHVKVLPLNEALEYLGD